MSQGLRDMLANRKFAIPLIILLAFCLIGLILVGIVLILRPGATETGTPVAQTTFTATLEPTTRPIPTSIPTNSPIPRASPTLVPLGTPVISAATGTAASPAGGTATPGGAATGTAASPSATATPPTDEELADTGIGWGLILFSGIGLALLAVVARRLRLAQ